MEAFAPIDQLIPLFTNAGANSGDYFGDIAYEFWKVFVYLAIAWAAIRVTCGETTLTSGGTQLTGWFLRIWMIGFFAAFLLPVIVPALFEGALGIGSGVSGGVLTAADFFAPTKLFKIGWIEVEKLMKHSMSRSTDIWTFFPNVISIFYFGAASAVILICFIFIILCVILSFAFFVMEGIGTLVGVAAMASQKTSWMGQGGPVALVNRFYGLVILSASLSIGIMAFDLVRLSGAPTLAQAVTAFVVAIIIAVLVWKSEQLGAAISRGMPGPQAGGFASGLLGVAGSVAASGIATGGAMAARGIGSMLPGGATTPPTPPGRGGSAPSPSPAPSGSDGHADQPYGPPPPSKAHHAEWAAAQISERARQMPKGHGEGAQAPTKQQWQDAAIMGTDISGMTRSQAACALSAHQEWYQQNGGVSAIPTPKSSPSPSGSAAWLAPGAPIGPNSGGRGWAGGGHASISPEHIQRIGQGGGIGGTGRRGVTPAKVSTRDLAVSTLRWHEYQRNQNKAA